MDDLSSLLPVAVVLLVIVVGVAFWQRRATVDASARPRPSGLSSPPAPIAATAAAPASRLVHDDVLGRLFHDGKRLWEADEDMAFAGTTVCVEIDGGPEGPAETLREIARAAIAQQGELDARARSMLVPALPDLGWEGMPLTPFSIAVRPDADQRLVGVLWYEVGDMDGEIGVASADQWRTLEIERMD